MINVFIVGSKGIPARYGGFETFVDKLTQNKTSDEIKYFVSCMGTGQVFEYNGATCFPIRLKKDTPFNRMLNVSSALSWIEKYIKAHSNKYDKNIIYVLGCRVGLLMWKHKRKLRRLGCFIIVNPDGLEWRRDKWSKIEKKILLYSQNSLIKSSDYIVCDSKGIRDYIYEAYPNINKENIEYIAYGSDIEKPAVPENALINWLSQVNCSPRDYYLIVGRFVSENNYEIIIREFMQSKTSKKLLIITDISENKLYWRLKNNLNYESDPRIIFAGTLYDDNLLKAIRENAYCYIHGHSVGGTNPSLLEALSYTKINLLYDVAFNREVGREQCLYFTDNVGSLSSLLDELEDKANYKVVYDRFNPQSIIEEFYSWKFINDEYQKLFFKIANK